MTSPHCSYCNAVLPPLAAPPTVERIPCPRCGELVPAARWQIAASPSPAKIAAIGGGRPAGGPPGIRQTLLVVLSVMLVMAIIGLSYMLWTTKLRRSRDPKGALDPITYRKPLELPGLGHLPANSDLIVGVHIAECLADPKVGKPLLDEPRPALLDSVLKQLPRVTGMPLEEIDHVVLAASFDRPQITAVIKTRRPYSLEKIVEAIKPASSIEYQKYPLYQFALHPWGEALLWCVDEKTLLGVVRLDVPRPEHLAGLSPTPRPLTEVLHPTLHDALKERLARQQFVWAVGRPEKITALKEALPIVLLKEADLASIGSIKTFALGIEPIEGLTLTGHFHAADAKSAVRLKAMLDDVKFEGAKSQKVEVPPADQEQWLTWQLRSDVPAMRAWLNRGQEGKK